MKFFKFFVFACAISITTLGSAQPNGNNPDKVLFTVGDEAVSLSEFEYVFKKNNANAHFHEKEVRDYLDLYIKFKLKVKEAEDIQIDTFPAVRNELETYKTQLLNSYIEKELLEDVTKKTYDRLQEDVKISHILVKVPAGAAPEDTVKAYNKIMDIRKRIMRGENFEKAALSASEDDYVKQNKGDLGFLTAMQIPFYNFENAIYETPTGKVSMPVRTALGYHLVHPTAKRPAVGQIQVAHILIKADENATKEEIEAAKKKADEVYKKLVDGTDFKLLAKEYSDDLSNKETGGVLQPFGTGQMVSEFENAAFGLKKDLDFSKPVRTNYGFHIIQRLEKFDVPEYAEMKEQLKQNVQKDERYKLEKDALVNSFKRKYGYMEFPQAKEEVFSLLDSTYYRGNWQVNDSKYQQDLFVLENKKIKQDDLIRYIKDNQRKYRNGSFEAIFSNIYDQFVQEIVLDYGLSQKFPDYARLKGEYQDGIVMFDLMEKKVWTKAIEDTAGLRKFYEANKGKYMWDKRADADIFYVADAKTAKKVQKKAKRMDNISLMKKFNKDEKNPVVTVVEGKYEKGANKTIDSTNWQLGWSEIMPADKDRVMMVRVNKILDPMPKSLNEARGFYIADYQDYLEKEWMNELRKKYPVKVNEAVLKSMVEEHDH